MKRKAKVIKAYSSCYPNPVFFKKHEIIETGREDKEFPGWIWVQTMDGNKGWAPLEILEIASSQAKAKESYCAKELTTELGLELTILRIISGWLYVKSDSDEEGWIPELTVEFI